MGNAFRKLRAKEELDIIASSPAEDHVFKVDNFDALEQIRQKLQEKIFSIEGKDVDLKQLKIIFTFSDENTVNDLDPNTMNSFMLFIRESHIKLNINLLYAREMDNIRKHSDTV